MSCHFWSSCMSFSKKKFTNLKVPEPGSAICNLSLEDHSLTFFLVLIQHDNLNAGKTKEIL